MTPSASQISFWQRLRGIPSRVAPRLGVFLPERAPKTCPDCSADLRRSPLYREMRVCDYCGHHFPLGARQRIHTLVDPHTFVEIEKYLTTRAADPAYAKRVRRAARETHLREAVVIGAAKIQGLDVMLTVLDFGFIGGTMGAVAGEKIARAFEYALQRKIPLIAVTSSGGARIQEGMLALMQMAKTTGAAQRFQRTGRPFITILAHPTTGGVYASFVNLADILLAEPRALIGFSGPRIVEIISRQKLPGDSHRAESLLEHGMVDAVVTRPQLRGTLAKILHAIGSRASSLPLPSGSQPSPTTQSALGVQPTAPNSKTAWESVELARRPDRPTTLTYIRAIFSDFTELHGDRYFGDDPAIIAGIAKLGEQGVVIIGHERGRASDRDQRHGGRAEPEGYRKAQRVMELAAKWNLPVITFVDTPGADATYEAEKRGIGISLSHSIAAMLALPVPTVTAIIGEGGSGGALALAAADRVLMLQHAIYSVISPEGASAILYGDSAHAQELTESLHLTAGELQARGIIDAIIPEPNGGAHTDPTAVAQSVKAFLKKELYELEAFRPEELLAARYEKYREIGLDHSDESKGHQQHTP